MVSRLLLVAALVGMASATPALADPAVTYTLPNPWTAPVLPPEEGSTVAGGDPSEAPRSTDRVARLQATAATSYAGFMFPFGTSLGYVMAGESGRGMAVGLGQLAVDALAVLVGYQLGSAQIQATPRGPVDMSILTMSLSIAGAYLVANTAYTAVSAWDVYHRPVWDAPPGPVKP